MHIFLALIGLAIGWVAGLFASDHLLSPVQLDRSGKVAVATLSGVVVMIDPVGAGRGPFLGSPLGQLSLEGSLADIWPRDEEDR